MASDESQTLVKHLTVGADDSYYRICFDIFRKRNKTRGTQLEYEDMLTNIVNNVQPMVMTSVAESTNRTLTALGVGSGDGTAEDFFISHFKPHVGQILQRIVEPSELLLKRHQAKVSQNNQQEVTFDWRQQTIEEYMETVKESGSDEAKYHLITVIHSAYYWQNLEESLSFLCNRLEKNGVLLILHRSEFTTSARLCALLPPRLTKVFYNSSRTITDYFDSKGIPYNVIGWPQTLDLDGCLADNLSEEVSRFLDHITHVRDFCTASLPEGVREQVFSTLREIVASATPGTQEVEHLQHFIVVQRQEE